MLTSASLWQKLNGLVKDEELNTTGILTSSRVAKDNMLSKRKNEMENTKIGHRRGLEEINITVKGILYKIKVKEETETKRKPENMSP